MKRNFDRKYHYLYKITNLINGKCYYGIHSTDNLDDGYMGSGILITKAISKYGKENFSKEILSFYNNRRELINAEKEYVTINEVKNDDCYNCCLGGYAQLSGPENMHYGIPLTEEHRKKIGDAQRGEKNHMYGKHPSEKTRQLMSLSQKERLKISPHPLLGTKHSEEHKQQISETLKRLYREGLRLPPMLNKKHSEETKRLFREHMSGEKHPNYGKHLSEEWKNKISQSNKGKFVGEKSILYGKFGHEHPAAKPVYQYDKDGNLIKKHLSIIDAANETGICKANISGCCRGNRKSAGGFIWKFQEIPQKED